jgi:hypothetical protein
MRDAFELENSASTNELTSKEGLPDTSQLFAASFEARYAPLSYPTAGGDQRCSSLPRQLAGFRLGNRRNGIQELALSNFFQINRDRVSDFQPVEISLGPLSDGRADAHPRHLRSRNPAYKIKLFVTGYLDIVKSTVSLASKEFDRVDVFSFPPHHVHAP